MAPSTKGPFISSLVRHWQQLPSSQQRQVQLTLTDTRVLVEATTSFDLFSSCTLGVQLPWTSALWKYRRQLDLTFARLARKPLSVILSKSKQISSLHLLKILAVVYRKKRKSFRKLLDHLELSGKSQHYLLLISTTFAFIVAASTSAVAFTAVELGATTAAITLAVFVVRMSWSLDWLAH